MHDDRTNEEDIDPNIILQMYSPLVASQRIMVGQAKNPYHQITTANGFTLILKQFSDYVFVAINGDDEETADFLHRKVLMLRHIITFLYGPCIEEVRPHKHKERVMRWKLIGQFLQTWCDMYKSEQSILVEAVERLHVNKMLNSRSIELLEKALKQVKDTGGERHATHAMLVVHGKLLSLYSVKNASALRSCDQLMLILLVNMLFHNEESHEALTEFPTLSSRHTIARSTSNPVPPVKIGSSVSLSSWLTHTQNSVTQSGSTPAQSGPEESSSDLEMGPSSSDQPGSDSEASRDTFPDNHSQSREEHHSNEAQSRDELHSDQSRNQFHSNQPQSRDEVPDNHSHNDVQAASKDNEFTASRDTADSFSQVSTTHSHAPILESGRIMRIPSEREISHRSLDYGASQNSDVNDSATHAQSLEGELNQQTDTSKFVILQKGDNFKTSYANSGTVTLTTILEKANQNVLSKDVNKTHDSVNQDANSNAASNLLTTGINKSPRLDRRTFQSTNQHQAARPRDTQPHSAPVRGTDSGSSEVSWRTPEATTYEYPSLSVMLRRGENDGVPHTAHCVHVMPAIYLVIVCERPKVQYAKIIQDTLKIIRAILTMTPGLVSKISPKQLLESVDTNVKKLGDLLKKSKGSTHIERVIVDIANKWSTAKQLNLHSHFPDPSADECDLPPRIESCLCSMLEKLHDLFRLIYLHRKHVTAEQEERMHDALTLAHGTLYRGLLDYKDYIVIRAQRNLAMTTYYNEFPGMVHFMFVNRTTNHVICASFSESSAEEQVPEQVPVQKRVWEMYEEMRVKLVTGHTTAIIRQAGFVFSYFLWFEDFQGGFTVAPHKTYSGTHDVNKLPGTLTFNFYDWLQRAMFPRVERRALQCYEMCVMHVDIVPTELSLSHCRKLAAKLWQGSGDSSSSVSLL